MAKAGPAGVGEELIYEPRVQRKYLQHPGDKWVILPVGPVPLVVDQPGEVVHSGRAHQRLGERIVEQALVGGHRPGGRAERGGHANTGGGIPRVAVGRNHLRYQPSERRRRARPKAARQPSSSSAVTEDATTMKLAATPADVALRKTMPTTTVDSHTTTPVGTTAVGRRQPREASHPRAVPVRNGQAVDATPVTLSPSS